MYLSREIRDLEGRAHPMAGVFPFTVRMLPRLKALGYREVTLTAPGLLGPAGTKARGHEFHYSEIVGEPDGVPRLYRLTPRRGGEAVSEGYGAKPRPGQLRAPPLRQQPRSGPAPGGELPGV